MRMRQKIVAGMVFLVGCAACCALPILAGAGASGLAAGVVSELKGWSGWLIGLGVAMLVALTAAALIVHRRRCDQKGGCD